MFENILYKDPVEVRELRELLIRSILHNEKNPQAEALCTNLLQAYTEAIRLKRLGVNTTKGYGAERLYLDTYDAIYGAEEVGSWPECLPLEEDREYPDLILQEVARALAQNEAARRDAYFRYVQKTEGQEAENGQ